MQVVPLEQHLMSQYQASVIGLSLPCQVIAQQMDIIVAFKWWNEILEKTLIVL